VPAEQITSVTADARADDIHATAAAHDRSRLLVRDGPLVVGSVHTRDALIARARGKAVTARELARPVPELAGQDTVGHAIEQLRQRRASLAVVCDDTGRLTGLVTLDDLLARLLDPVRG
jgi:CBS domain containing-hemolysin-like protein